MNREIVKMMDGDGNEVDDISKAKRLIIAEKDAAGKWIEKHVEIDKADIVRE